MDSKEIARTPGAPGQYSSAVRAGDVVYIAGMVATDWDGDITAQAQDVFSQIDAALRGQGASRDGLLSVTVYLKTFDDYAAFKAAYADWIDPAHLPARATVRADLLDPRLKVEMQAKAALGNEKSPRTATGMVEAAKDSTPAISVDQALGIVNSTTHLIIDVRDESELSSGEIPGALHIPRGGLEFALDPTSDFYRKELSGPRRLILVCGSGGRGALAAQLAQTFGYDAAYLAGGMKAWRAAEGPVTIPSG